MTSGHSLYGTPEAPERSHLDADVVARWRQLFGDELTFEKPNRLVVAYPTADYLPPHRDLDPRVGLVLEAQWTGRAVVASATAHRAGAMCALPPGEHLTHDNLLAALSGLKARCLAFAFDTTERRDRRAALWSAAALLARVLGATPPPLYDDPQATKPPPPKKKGKRK